MAQRMTQHDLDRLWSVYDREFTYHTVGGVLLFTAGLILTFIGLLMTFYPPAYGPALLLTVVGFTAVTISVRLPVYQAR